MTTVLDHYISITSYQKFLDPPLHSFQTLIVSINYLIQRKCTAAANNRWGPTIGFIRKSKLPELAGVTTK